MRYFMQAIEDREKYLLEKVEKIRQYKLNELSDQMNSLRGILAGLAHTNETLVNCLDLEGVDLFVAKEKGLSQIEYFASMYKSLQPKDDSISFVPPNYDLIEQLKRQCDVMPASMSGMHSLQSVGYPLALPMSSSSSGVTTSADLTRSMNSRIVNYYDNNHSIMSLGLEVAPQRGIGQAIAGYWLSVSLKPTRDPVPGVPVLSFAREGQDEGQVSRPWGLCVDRDGNIIVADRRNNRIQIFSNEGKFKSLFGSKGTGPGEFDLPAGITTDNYGRIIVIDKDNHRVQIFTPSGQFILKFGSFGKECGQFQYPWDVAVNTLGNIAVTDTRNHRIQLFTGDGTYITKFVFEGANPTKMLKGPTTPRGVCFTTSGHIIISDFENHRLIMIDGTLSRVICAVGREGSGNSELNRPSGIVTDDEGRIIVADSKNHRVMVFSADLRYQWAVDLKSPGLDDKDRPSDVALTPEGYLVVLFETLPDTARDNASHGKQYIKVY
ncbi:Protein wech [Eumeta japonica]|uniref:Protein wech n=1 Tax=Eumeta variegata TaxID=151549 RepID=A0A4C1VD90_EUMVA|nr:Protein wech [Eumeta japonica]